MLDLHTHTLLSDGELLPSELLRRAAVKGVKYLALTDHVDVTNVAEVLAKLSKLKDYADDYDVEFLVGVEITHVPPRRIDRVVELAWREGAEIVLVHGETVAEPVAEGTNRAAIESEVSVLAHPGLLSLEDAELAAKNGIYLEISARKGHSLTNGLVARLADEVGAKLVFGSDAHSFGDLLSPHEIGKVIAGSGTKQNVLENAEKLFKKLR